MRRAPTSTLFPYTTLFRSGLRQHLERRAQLPAELPERDVGAVDVLERAQALRRRHAGGQRVLERLLREVALAGGGERSEEHTSELQSRLHLVCRLLLERKI